MQPLPKQDVDAVRTFNRFYTRQIGVLNEGVLDSAFTLTQARVLFELARSQQATAKQLQDELDLDAGYLSRILRGFAKRKLIARERSKEDSRRILLSLSALGRKTFQGLDRGSHQSIAHMLEGLRPSDRQRLLASLDEVSRTLQHRPAPNATNVELRGTRPGDIGWAIERHGTLYASEYGWNLEFEALVAKLFADFVANPDREHSRMWIAEVAGERAGCVFVVRNADDRNAAQLRCLLVDAKARGKGVGARLVQECITFARQSGFNKMMLWTNDVLVAARRIYEAEGFKLVASSKHYSFGKELVGQTWELEL